MFQGLSKFIYFSVFFSVISSAKSTNDSGFVAESDPQEIIKSEESSSESDAKDDDVAEDKNPVSRSAYKLKEIDKDLSDPRDDALYRQVKLAVEFQEFENARKLTMEYLAKVDSPEALRKELLINLALLYYENNDLVKAIQIYEKYIQSFPNDRQLSSIYLLLGNFYREIGAYQLAISRYYSVLNSSIKINQEDLPEYKKLARKAQKSIADTHYQKEEYSDAIKFYRRLNRLNLSNDLMAEIKFKMINSYFQLKEYDRVITDAKLFIEKYPQSYFLPEAYFVISKAYYETKRSKDSINSVIKLLKTPQLMEEKNWENWEYWQKRTANQLAKEFYQQGDYLGTLKIYQTMVTLKDNPEWQWPVIYQMGLCFERLQMPPKAITAYQMILTGDSWKDMDYDMTETMSYLKEMSQWRLDNLKWLIETDRQFQLMTFPPGSK